MSGKYFLTLYIVKKILLDTAAVQRDAAISYVTHPRDLPRAPGKEELQLPRPGQLTCRTLITQTGSLWLAGRQVLASLDQRTKYGNHRRKTVLEVGWLWICLGVVLSRDLPFRRLSLLALLCCSIPHDDAHQISQETLGNHEIP